MEKVILKAENISKQYRLGVVGTGTVKHDFNRFLARILGKPDPYLKVGAENDRSAKATGNYVWALQDINFELKRGEVLGIIGKNGAGKSTLLKILSRVTAPTTGVIKTRGRIASLLEVGTGFHPELTGLENIYLNGAILGMTKAEIKRKEEEIIEFSGCQMYIDTPVKRYSSGMRVRLAFAVAAHLEPDILVVDEVLAVGDVDFQKKAIGKMQEISEGDGRTVLFVSHNMAAVKNLCTRGIVLENGKSIYEGNANDAVEYYLKNAFQLSKTHILERTDRKGNKKLQIESIQIENNRDVEVSELYSGESYAMKFYYTQYKPVEAGQLTLVVQFRNQKDELACTIGTDEMGIRFSEISKSGYFQISIPKLQFREGEYTISYMISEKLSQNSKHNVIDNLQNARTMSVMKSDYWKSGVFNRPNGFIQEASIELIKK
ncbi:ABC transporter ATP-binding protein [Rasiella rasia]|uniref:ABC transporter ATP-binding protein n=1 Tax=Rasiella rasia TaxID=2744027 RepID=A0A6G6GSC3_9FLAO|nr:ABC transporter ATP-binding protein [Rasiella rasia]QIE60611.1 ABC transporter ATP-binding protein [Rasiella rasia]